MPRPEGPTRGRSRSIPLVFVFLIASIVGSAAAGEPDPLGRGEVSDHTVRLRIQRPTAPVPPYVRRTALDRLAQFPHLLRVPGKGLVPGLLSHPRALSGRSGQGNARWDPAGTLPPSVLSARRLEHARRMLAARDGKDWLAAFRGASALAESPDTVRILALRVDFLKDGPGGKTTGNGRFDLRRDAEATSIPIDPPPHDKAYFEAHLKAVARYYHVMSGGALELVYDVFPAQPDSAYHLPDTQRYGPWIFSNSNPDVFQHAIDLVGDALAAADTTDPTIDFGRYQSVLLFHAGPDFQGDGSRDSPWDIPSFNLGVADPFAVRDSTVRFDLVMVVPETVSQDGFVGAMNGVLAHEFGHQLGFADLYDVRQGLPVVGSFSLMDSGDNLYATVAVVDSTHSPPDTTLVSARGTLPASLDPWHKALFFPRGVTLTDADAHLTADQDSFRVHLAPVELANELLYVPLNLAEYLLLENRHWDASGDSRMSELRRDKATGVILGPVPADSSAEGDSPGYREYDWLLPAEGVLIWHIDQKAISTGLNTPYGGVNIFFSRPGVGVVEADGIRDIGTGSPEFLGGPYDPFYVGGYACFGPDTRPTSDTNDGTPSGLAVCVLDSIGTDMRVRVSSETNPRGWPVAFVGSPAEEQFLSTDLDGDGAAEVLVAAGEAILAWHLDGSPVRFDEGALFVKFGLPIEGALSVQPDFAQIRAVGDTLRAPVVAAVSGGTLWLTGQDGSALAAWPGPDSSLVASSPTLLDSKVIVGCLDGRARILGLDLQAGTIEILAERRLSAHPIRAVGAGRLGSGSVRVFWASQDGESGAFTWSGGPGTLSDWSVADDPGVAKGDAVAVLAVDPGGTEGWRFLSEWEDGTLVWRNADGTFLPGWPARLGAVPAGSPILCDADEDGVLETVVAGADGLLHAYTWNGVDQFHWPRSVWSADDTDRPALESGPRALDLNGDGIPEILLQRSDGYVYAFDGEGESVAGWPLSTGSSGRSGPDWISGGGAYGPRLALGSDYGTTSGGDPISALSLLRVRGAQAEGVGFFAVPGVDAARTRFYPRDRVPPPKPAGGTLEAASVRFYPNPLRGPQVTVHFVLGRPARVTCEAFDLSGQKVAVLEGDGAPGLAGNELRWDLSRLASGIYQLRFRARGQGFDAEQFQQLAVVR